MATIEVCNNIADPLLFLTSIGHREGHSICVCVLQDMFATGVDTTGAVAVPFTEDVPPEGRKEYEQAKHTAKILQKTFRKHFFSLFCENHSS